MRISFPVLTQATLELFGSFICLMLSIIIFLNGHERKSGRSLRRMFLCAAGIFFSEACAYALRGRTEGYFQIFDHIFNFLVFFLNLVLMNMSVGFLYNILTERGAKPGNLLKKSVHFLTTVCFVLLAVNIFNRWMYYFDENSLYHRNNGWYIYTFLTLVCTVIFAISTIRNRRALGLKYTLVILMYIVMPVVGILLQSLFYGISFTNIGIFISLIAMLLTHLHDWSQDKEGMERERKSFDIILLFIIMSVSMSASIISCVGCIRRISDKKSESDSIIIAHMVNDGIENKFIKPIMVAETMANDISLKESMKRSGEGDPSLVADRVAYYLSSIRDGFGYNMVFAVCSNSKAYYSYDGLVRLIHADPDRTDEWYDEFVQNKKHYDLRVDSTEGGKDGYSVYVNTEICDENGGFLGVCGVGIEMDELKELILSYEEQYDLQITLVDENGLIQVSSDDALIDKKYENSTYMSQVGEEEFYYERNEDYCRSTKLMKNLGWYLVIEDHEPDKLNVIELIFTSVIIFIISIVFMGIVFAVISIREKKVENELMERNRISMTDDMTGLYNRRAFEADCEKIRSTGDTEKLCILMMDLNGLKKANDTYGHAAGDELLLGAAKCMQISLQKYGRVYRVGGDEFVALLRCSRERLKISVDTLDHQTEGWVGTYQSEISLSKGIVICDEHEDMSLDEMKDLADKLMYADKDEYYKKNNLTRRKV